MPWKWFWRSSWRSSWRWVSCWKREEQYLNLEALYKDCKEHDRNAIRFAFQKKYAEAQSEIQKKEKKMSDIRQMVISCIDENRKEELDALEKKRGIIIG